jgi:hypothetical protein
MYGKPYIRRMTTGHRTSLSATIIGPCWASRLGRFGFARLDDGRRVELCSLDEAHRSGVRLEVRQDARGRWSPARAALTGEAR